MASIFYLDYDNGNDATTATPLGWWSVAFTGGSGTAPVADETVTGATSGSTAKITIISISSGSWAGNNAAGTMYFYGKSAAFASEQVNCAGGGHFHITSDFTYCAWKTITSGATAARTAPGDTVRIAKSPAPVSMGNGTWNNLSKTVTLASAQNATIDLCEAAWTANGAGDTTVALTAVATDAKQGSYCMKLTLDAAPQASVMQAYYDIYTHNTTVHDLSAYQKISFWIKNSAAIPNATTWKVCLCSDTAGATPVDTFYIPAIPSTATWVPLTLTKDGGGNLGNAIKSIAIWTDSTAPTASSNILVDCFIACTTDGLNLQSLISKNSAEQGGTEGWFGIQSIDGVTILLDNHNANKSNAGRGYHGATETVTTYKRETTKTAMVATSTANVASINEAGSLAAGNIQYQGGYSTVNNAQEGETFFDGLNGFGYGIYIGNSYGFLTFNYVNVVRYQNGYYYSGASTLYLPNVSYSNCTYNLGGSSGSCLNIYGTVKSFNNGNNGFDFTGQNSYVATLYACNNLSNGVRMGSNCVIGNLIAENNSSKGIYFATGNGSKVLGGDTKNNASGGVTGQYGVTGYLKNFVINEATEVASLTSYSDDRIYSHNHDNTAGNHWIFCVDGTINALATNRVGGTGSMWKLAISSSRRGSNYPLKLVIARIAVAANADVTIKAYLKKDHATNVVGKLVCPGGQIAGVASDVVATKANDTNWEELTISLSGASQPTEAGVIEIEAWAEYSAGNSNVYVEDMTISQA